MQSDLFDTYMFMVIWGLWKQNDYIMEHGV